MLIAKQQLGFLLRAVLEQRLAQGCDLDRDVFIGRIQAAADSYDALHALALELRDPPLRADWPYIEPVVWDAIVDEAPLLADASDWVAPDLPRASEAAQSGFLASVCGCILGKPIEVDPSLAELKAAGMAQGEWPLSDYISVEFLERLGRRHDSWQQTTRGNIGAVAADDDIHYTLLGMRVLEQFGPAFTHDDLFATWSLNIPPGWTWGPERSALLGQGLARHHLFTEAGLQAEARDVLFLNPGDEMCGALIRADAYGYACPGNPALAAQLAWKDAAFTHIKTGVYGPMFVAALIALCHAAEAGQPGNQRLELAEAASDYIPASTRFAEVLRQSREAVYAAGDWEQGYHAIHGKYGEYTHCTVYQEIGTLLNTLKFAQDVGHGLGLQVSQGNDTDSFGATAGSVLGVLFGPGYLADRWLQPFNDRLNLALGEINEQSLNETAFRMAALPALVYSLKSGREAVITGA